MSYTVEITLAERPSLDGEIETRMYQLPEPYAAMADAKEAAVAHLTGLGLEPAAAIYNIFDRAGFTVASNVEQPTEAR